MPEGILRDSFRSETSFDILGPVGPEGGETAEETTTFNRRPGTNGPDRARREPRDGRAAEGIPVLEAEGRRLPCDLRN